MIKPLEVIRAEHRNIARVLEAMESVIAKPPGDAGLCVLSSAVYYMRTFPDRLHHPKEEEFLFKALLRVAPDASNLIAALVLEHQEGVELLDEMDRNLQAYVREPDAWRKALAESVAAYVAFQRRHMGHEESEILMVAEQRLSADDLAAVGRAFAANVDPLYGDDFAVGYAALARHIQEGARKNSMAS